MSFHVLMVFVYLICEVPVPIFWSFKNLGCLNVELWICYKFCIHVLCQAVLQLFLLVATNIFYPRQMKTCSHTYLKTNIYNSSFHACPKLQTIQIPYSGQMNKLLCIHAIHTQQWKGTTYCYLQQLGWNLMALFWVKEASLKGYILYDSFVGEPLKHLVRENRSVLGRVWEWAWGWLQRDIARRSFFFFFWGNGNVLYPDCGSSYMNLNCK